VKWRKRRKSEVAGFIRGTERGMGKGSGKKRTKIISLNPVRDDAKRGRLHLTRRPLIGSLNS